MKTYDELLAENEALASKLAIVSETAFKSLNTGFLLVRLDALRIICGILENDDQQCLRDVQAEAGRAGFVAGAEMWSDYSVKSRYKDDYLVDIEADADRYAAKIRSTGTWLKDSNVNGGKRQGGEK